MLPLVLSLLINIFFCVGFILSLVHSCLVFFFFLVCVSPLFSFPLYPSFMPLVRHSVSFSYSPFPSPYEFFTFFYHLPFSPLLPSLFSLAPSVIFSLLYSLSFVTHPPSFISHFLLLLFLTCVFFVSSSLHLFFPVFFLSLIPCPSLSIPHTCPSASPSGSNRGGGSVSCSYGCESRRSFRHQSPCGLGCPSPPHPPRRLAWLQRGRQEA